MISEYFPWSDEYSVGIRLIDNDHRELFSVVNDLHALQEEDAPIDQLRDITNRLTRYAQEHFEREEHLMAEYKFPGLNAHRQKHHDFVRMIYAIRKIELECPKRLDLSKLLDFLVGWLRRHILNVDREYITFLSGDYGRRDSDLTRPLLEDAEDAKDGPVSEDVVVTVTVPFSAVSTIRRCARILRLGGDDAGALESLTDPISGMTIDDALEIAKVVLQPS